MEVRRVGRLAQDLPCSWELDLDVEVPVPLDLELVTYGYVQSVFRVGRIMRFHFLSYNEINIIYWILELCY